MVAESGVAAAGSWRPWISALYNGRTVCWQTGSYAYDGAGDVKTVGSDSFVYDTVSRLRSGSVSAVGKTQCYGFDAFGNLNGQSTVITGQTCTPSPIAIDPTTNRLSAVTYDTAGNQTNWDNGLYTYSWYPTNQMTSFSGSGRNSVYGYDAAGERIGWFDSADAGIHYTIRDLSGKVLREYFESGGVWSWKTDYVFAGGQPLATIESPGTVKHLSLDHLGTVRLITDASGNQLALHHYYPFGMEANPYLDTVRLKFTGHERDLRDTSNTTDDLDYMHARHYNPNLGRFLSTDLLRGNAHAPQSFNLFAYVSGNPMNFRDRFGLDGQHYHVVEGDAYLPGLLYYTDQITVSGSDSWGFSVGELLNFFLGQPDEGAPGGGPIGGTAGTTPTVEPAPNRRPCPGWAENGDPGRPDFASLKINVAIPNPYTLTLVGITIQDSLDRYGHGYFSVGLTAGKSASFLSGSLTAGALDQLATPSSTEVSDYLSGWNVSGFVGAIVGAGEGWTPGKGFATEAGLASPQAGGSVTYSWDTGCVSSGS